MKKLQGTRAGRPIAIAFDTDMLMQFGVKLFVTDEAFFSPDWISNIALINAYDMRSGERIFLYQPGVCDAPQGVPGDHQECEGQHRPGRLVAEQAGHVLPRDGGLV